MTYTVTDLITKSFYLSQVISRELQQISGQQLSDGLTWLNALLSLKSVDTRLIPYYQQFEFTAVIGQEEYFVPNLVSPETLTFNIGPVRYSTQPTSRRAYFGSGRIDNITSLPFNWHFERVQGGSNIYLYFIPDMQYPIKIWGKFAFTNVTLNQDLSQTYDEYYIDYLRYRLAKRICSEYAIPMQPQALEELTELEDSMHDISPPDLTMVKLSYLHVEPGINWGDINVGRGWRPGN